MTLSIPSVTNLTRQASRWAGASGSVVQALQSAAKRTGVSFDYLMDKARQESSFNPTAKAKTSSASGLFQFIESTWLSTVKTYGEQFGMGDLAAKISIDGKGNPKVADAATRQQILKLRENPEVAATFTAALTKDNADFLENSLGNKVGENELYLAHFLGLNGANKFLKARQDNGNQFAADLFPNAAAANKNVFFEASGKKRSLNEVYNFFADRLQGKEGPVIADNGTNSPVKLPTAATSAPTMASISGLNSLVKNLPDVVSTTEDTQVGGLAAQRLILETYLTGMTQFGNQDKDQRVEGKLLSPYTSFVLAQLKTADETKKSQEQGTEDRLQQVGKI